jgi:hypothetical protein
MVTHIYLRLKTGVADDHGHLSDYAALIGIYGVLLRTVIRQYLYVKSFSLVDDDHAVLK